MLDFAEKIEEKLNKKMLDFDDDKEDCIMLSPYMYSKVCAEAIGF